MSRWPLRWQIPTIAVALVVLAELIVGGATVLILDRVLVRQADERLAQILEQLQERPRGMVVAQRAADQDDLRPQAEVLIAVYRADGSLAEEITARANDGRPLPDVRVGEPSGRAYTARADGEPWRVRVVELANGATVVAHLPLAPARAATRVLAQSVAALALITAVVGAAIAWWATRRSLRPLEDARATAAAIAAGERGLRVPGADPRTEAGSLAASINLMLSRLDASFAAQEASQERLRRFLADASHELRTPLAAIQGYAELHQMGADTAGESMDRVAANAGRMASLVDDLLALARSDEAPGSLGGDEAVDLAALVAEAASDLRAQDPERDVSVDASEPVVVRGSARHLRQVLANLAGNVLAHTPDGTPVSLAARAVADVAQIEVRDHGPGFGGHGEQVFARFYRSDPARTRETGGAGLGLSIVAAIVADHGGTVAATDAPGGGGQVTIRLPLEAADA